MARQHPGDSIVRIAQARAADRADDHRVATFVHGVLASALVLLLVCIALAWCVALGLA